MKSLRYVIMLLLLGSLQVAFAQTERQTIAGAVMDADEQAIAYAHVVALSATDSSFIASRVTDEEGGFRFDSLPVPALLSVKCIGYKSQILPALPLMKIVLEEIPEELSEAVVVSSHYTRRKLSGETVVRMQGNPVAKGKLVLEALRFVKGVEVANNEILINGKPGTLIFLNDRQITMQEFQSIPTSMIKEVEILSNPGAAYGKEAQGGVMKVILRDVRGTIGSVTLSAQADKYGWVDALLSSSLQYQSGKFSLFNNFLIGAGEYRTRHERSDKYPLQTFFRQSHVDKDNKGFSENIGASYQFTPEQMIQVYGGFTLMCDEINQINSTDAIETLKQLSDKSLGNVNAGLFYKTNIGLGYGSSFSTRVEYLAQNNKENLSYIVGTEEQTKLKQKLNFLKVDPRLELHLKGRNDIEAGIRYSYLNDNNRIDGLSTPLLPMMDQQQFVISGGDFAPWAEYSRIIGSRMFVRAGLTYQLTHMKFADKLGLSGDYKTKYSGLYPNVMMQYLVSTQKPSAIEIAYRYDFSLPNYGYYNPIPIYQTDKFYSIGNHKLKQERFHTVEMNYYINTAWTLTYRLKSGKDMIHILSYQDSEQPEFTYTQPQNVGSLWQNYLSLGYSPEPKGFWQTNNRVYVRHQKEIMSGKRVQNTTFGWSLVQQFRIKENIGLTCTFAGRTKEKFLSYETNLSYSLDLGAYMTLLKDRLFINLSAANLLHSKDKIRIKTDFADMTRIDHSPLTRVKLSVSWNFSAGDQIRRKKSAEVSIPTREMPTL